MEHNTDTTQSMVCKVKENIEYAINNIINDGLQTNDVDCLSKLVDIHKDLANEEYWKMKEESLNMMYRGNRNYGTYEGDMYGRRSRDNRGRYTTSSRRYRGHDYIDDMSENYGRYSEGKEMYGNDNSTMKSLEYMLESVVDFMVMLEDEASSQEEVELIKKYARKISEM